LDLFEATLALADTSSLLRHPSLSSASIGQYMPALLARLSLSARARLRISHAEEL